MNEQLSKRVEELENIVHLLVLGDRYTFQKHIQLLDARNIQLGKSTGTMFGTETTQKAAFFGAVPVVQAGAISAPTAPGAIYAQSEAQSAVNAINSLRTTIKNFGITA